jgi:hypothetical protein
MLGHSHQYKLGNSSANSTKGFGLKNNPSKVSVAASTGESIVKSVAMNMFHPKPKNLKIRTSQPGENYQSDD